MHSILIINARATASKQPKKLKKTIERTNFRTIGTRTRATPRDARTNETKKERLLLWFLVLSVRRWCVVISTIGLESAQEGLRAITEYELVAPVDLEDALKHEPDSHQVKPADTSEQVRREHHETEQS